ncbi:hypothetical protein [Aeribacillus pallidus]|uniref:hypothetical protein n=1 Tax=Aeribacillus pallidus TaxID=33936 RepID=UPI003D1AA1B3
MRNLKIALLVGGIAIGVVGAGGYYYHQDSIAKAEEKKEVDPGSQTVAKEEVNNQPEVTDQKTEAQKLREKMNLWTETIPGIPDRKEYDDAYLFKPGKEQEAKQKLAELHDFYDDLLGWGKAEHINFRQLDMVQMQEDVQAFQNLLEPSKILNDVHYTQALLGVAFRYNDSMALRYVHRIFHDLDYHINGTEVDREWKVTDAFGGNPDEIRNYLLGSGLAKEE